MKTSTKVRIGLQILKSRATSSPRPFFVQYSLLNGCNMRCSYCNSPNRDDEQLDTATHKRILAGFAELGTARIKFLGGEPLLRSDLGELVDETKRLGMRAAMVTNALLIPQKFDIIRNLDELIISIDGREEAHDRQRGKGTWKRVMAAIDLCAASRVDFFLSAVVTKESTGEIDWLIDLARRLGVMVNFQLPQFNPEMYGLGAKQAVPQADLARQVLRKIIDAKRAGAPVLFTERSYSKTLAWSDFGTERRDLQSGESPCCAGTYFLQMEPNGDIYPCVLHVGTFKPKNAVRDGVRAAWEHGQKHACGSCYNTWLNENRAVFDLSPHVLRNFWNNYLNPSRPAAVAVVP